LNPPDARPPLWKRVEIISLPMVVLVLIATMLSAARNWKAYVAYREQATLSRDIGDGVRDLRNSIIDAETAQRGYLLTGDPQYRTPYDRAIVAIPNQMAHLRELTARDPAESSQVANLIRLIDLKTHELRETIAMRDSKGFQAALALVETNTGERSMEQIRAVSGRLIATESRRLVSLIALVRVRGGRTWLISAAGDFLLGLMLVFSSVAIFRATARREELIAALQEDDNRLRQLRAQSEAAEERVRNILESIGDGFVSFDRDWNVTYLNAEAERILGRPKAELLGKNYWREFPGTLGQDIERNYREAAAGQVPVSFETHLQDRNAWWEENIYPGKDGVLSVYFRDITQRKNFEERMRHTQKLESLGVLAGGIAHDFNNLLTAILGSASLMSEVLPANSPATPYLANVLAASERAAQLTRQMLAYSGRGRFVVERVDLSAQVREITELLHASLGGNIELVLNLQDGAFIEADAGQFQSVVMNLVINGAEAVGQTTGTVAVSTSFQQLDADYLRDNMSGDDLAPGLYVLLEVHDTGHGMDQATRARIFDPFFTTKFTGRGLGLAAVLGIVRGHKGAIRVYSHPGQGTTFKLFFPAVIGDEIPGALPAVTADHHGDATVLVVDDEDVVRSMAQATLRKYGYSVLLAANGLEAVNIFKLQPDRVSLVLLDMTMPVMSGEETLRELKTIREDVRVIVSSGYNEIEALRRFGDGVAGFLQKPYRAGVLAEKVKQSL
jgi:PAS domain S-box-containing protein